MFETFIKVTCSICGGECFFRAEIQENTFDQEVRIKLIKSGVKTICSSCRTEYEILLEKIIVFKYGNDLAQCKKEIDKSRRSDVQEINLCFSCPIPVCEHGKIKTPVLISELKSDSDVLQSCVDKINKIGLEIWSVKFIAGKTRCCDECGEISYVEDTEVYFSLKRLSA